MKEIGFPGKLLLSEASVRVQVQEALHVFGIGKFFTIWLKLGRMKLGEPKHFTEFICGCFGLFQISTGTWFKSSRQGWWFL